MIIWPSAMAIIGTQDPRDTESALALEVDCTDTALLQVW